MNRVSSVIIPGSKIFIVGETPGENEEQMGAPFVGPSGNLLNSCLRSAEIDRSQVSVGNVISVRPRNNNIELFVTKRKNLAKSIGMSWHEGIRAFAHPFVEDEIQRLKQEIEEVQPNVIVALGNLALMALTGESGIQSWRGSIIESRFYRKDGKPFKVIPSVHPALVLRQYPWKFLLTQDLRRVQREKSSPHIEYPKWNFLINPSFDAAEKWLRSLLERLDNEPTELSIDIETSRNQISCIGIAHTETDCICIPFHDRRKTAGNFWQVEEEEVELVMLINKILLHKNNRVIGQNFGYDKIYTGRTWMALPATAIDTSTYYHTAFPTARKKISIQASLFCRYYRYWKEEGKSKEDKKEWGSRVDPEKLWTYNCKDCCITFEVAQVLKKKIIPQLKLDIPSIELITKEKLSPIDFQMALDEPFSLMTMQGIRVDESARRKVAKELADKIDEMQGELVHIVSHPINPRSSLQLKDLFYKDLKQKPIYAKAKRGESNRRLTLDEDALDTIKKRDPIMGALTDRIVGIRRLTVFRSTFVMSKLREGRFHCTYDRDGTSSFRLSSRKDPMGYGNNGQNIPKGSGELAKTILDLGGKVSFEELVRHTGIKEDKLKAKVLELEDHGFVILRGSFPHWDILYQFYLPNVRKMFIPDKGMVLGDWDLDRADLQVVAWRACEFDGGSTQELKRMLKEGVDMHTEHAKILGVDRQLAKIFIHGTNYGGSSRTMAINCGITVHQSDGMQRRWFQARPGIKRWHEHVESQLRGTGGLRSSFGFQIFYFDRPEAVFSKALSWEPQHTVAVVINCGLLNLHRTQPSIIPMMQVHDSLVLQAPLSMDPLERDAIVKKNLSITVPFSDPLVIPVSGKWSDKSWGDVH